MAKFQTLSFLLGLVLLQLTVSADPPKISPAPAPAPLSAGKSPSPSPYPAPAPAPRLAAKSPSPLSLSPEARSPVSPSPSTGISSPPAPPPSVPGPGSSPTPSLAPSPANTSPAPVPSPINDHIVSVKNAMNADAGEAESSGGAKGGHTAGMVFGVIAAACLVGFGGLVYKKRQDNIRRAQFGYTARRDLL
ncbi:vegetative cell wall protein gp1-like [Cornus florida]|uniref:vegetative cell wall protein gp1-like n=1 Tax=Cornus florida TaxID=4283 RepID=UPI00289E730A|nr:vegetative cell wall protein gp1-like [Cornus florida]